MHLIGLYSRVERRLARAGVVFLAYFCQVGLIHLGHVSTNNCRYWLWKKTCSGDSQRTV